MKCVLVENDTKEILISNEKNLCHYDIYNCNNFLYVKYYNSKIKIDYSLFSCCEIKNKTNTYMTYLKNKINELNDNIIISSNSVISNENFENLILTTENDICNVVIKNCSFKNCRLLLKNVKNLLVSNNKIDSPLLIDNDPEYIKIGRAHV